MGVTCQECSSDRFFSLYFVWFNSLLSHIKNLESSRIVRVVSCTSTSDLLTRLSRFTNTKKDAVSHASKVNLSIIKLLEEESSDALWESHCPSAENNSSIFQLESCEHDFQIYLNNSHHSRYRDRSCRRHF
ncbi:unnamed protein product [Brassica oleracea]|nr:unnamed protein product [Brassica napus]